MCSKVGVKELDSIYYESTGNHLCSYNNEIYEYDSLSDVFYQFRDELQPIYEPTQVDDTEVVHGRGWKMVFHSNVQAKTFIDGIIKMRKYDLRAEEVF